MYIRWNYIESDGRLSESNCRLSGSDGRSGKNNGRLGESVMVVWWILGENNSTLGESNGRSCESDGTLCESDCGYGEDCVRVFHVVCVQHKEISHTTCHTPTFFNLGFASNRVEKWPTEDERHRFTQDRKKCKHYKYNIHKSCHQPHHNSHMN